MNGGQAQGIQKLGTQLAAVASPRAGDNFLRLCWVFSAGFPQGCSVAIQGLCDEYIPNYSQLLDNFLSFIEVIIDFSTS